VAEQQRNLDIQSIVGDRTSPTFDGAPDAVLDGVDVQVELLGCAFEARAGAQKHPQGFAKPFVAFGRGGERSEHLPNPGRRGGDVVAEQGRHREAGIANRRELTSGGTRCDRDGAAVLGLSMRTAEAVDARQRVADRDRGHHHPG